MPDTEFDFDEQDMLSTYKYRAYYTNLIDDKMRNIRERKSKVGPRSANAIQALVVLSEQLIAQISVAETPQQAEKLYNIFLQSYNATIKSLKSAGQEAEESKTQGGLGGSYATVDSSNDGKKEFISKPKTLKGSLEAISTTEPENKSLLGIVAVVAIFLLFR